MSRHLQASSKNAKCNASCQLKLTFRAKTLYSFKNQPSSLNQSRCKSVKLNKRKHFLKNSTTLATLELKVE